MSLPDAENAHAASVRVAFEEATLKRNNADRECSKSIDSAIRFGRFTAQCSADISQEFVSELKQKRYLVDCLECKIRNQVHGEKGKYCTVRWDKK